MRNAFLALLLACVLLTTATAADWNRFRGPNGSGVAENCKPPVALDLQKPAWKVPIPSGVSSPILTGGKLFLTAVEFLDEEKEKGNLLTLAFDKATGKQLWKQAAPEVTLGRTYGTSSPAASTPAADAECVVAYFGSYGLLCYDHSGKELWKKPIPRPENEYGMATSPILSGDRVILVLDSKKKAKGGLTLSKVVAFDKKTGDIAWETPRPFCSSGWSTPIVWTQEDGTQELVILGAYRLYGYDLATGEEKWFVQGFSRETIGVPVAGDGKLFASAARRGGEGDANPDPKPFWDWVLQFDKNKDGKFHKSEIGHHFTFPIRLELPTGYPGMGWPMPKDPEKRKKRQEGVFDMVDSNKDGFWTQEELMKMVTNMGVAPQLVAVKPGGKGDITEKDQLAWKREQDIPEMPSLLYHDGLLYLLRKGGRLMVVNPANGELFFRERVAAAGQYSASPIWANGKIYTASEPGKISIIQAGKEPKLLSQCDFNERLAATPAIDTNSLYVRSQNYLWCFR